jgi:hypothetical protein
MAAKEQRRAFRWRLLALGGLVVVLVLVVVLWPKPTRGALGVATTSAAVEPSGVLRGVLVAAREDDRACYSMSVRGATAVLRFPEGWSADERLGLRDTSGGVVAQPGARITMLGAPGRIGTVAGCPDRGRIWTITSVNLRADR